MSFLLGTLAALTILPSVSTISNARINNINQITKVSKKINQPANLYPVLKVNNVTQNFQKDLNSNFEKDVADGTITNLPQKEKYELRINRVLQVPDHKYLYLVLTSIWVKDNKSNYYIDPNHQLDMWGYNTNMTEPGSPFVLLNQVTNNGVGKYSYFKNVQKTNFQIIKTAPLSPKYDTYGLTFNFRSIDLESLNDETKKNKIPTYLLFRNFFSVQNDNFVNPGNSEPALKLETDSAKTFNTFFFAGTAVQNSADDNSSSSLYIGTENNKPVIYFWINMYSNGSDSFIGHYFKLSGDYANGGSLVKIDPDIDPDNLNPGPNTQNLTHYQSNPSSTPAVQFGQNIYTISHVTYSRNYRYTKINLANPVNFHYVKDAEWAVATVYNEKNKTSDDYWSSRLVSNVSSKTSMLKNQIFFAYNKYRYYDSSGDNNSYFYAIDTINEKFNNVTVNGISSAHTGIWDSNPANLTTNVDDTKKTSTSLLFSNKIYTLNFDNSKSNNKLSFLCNQLPETFGNDLSDNVLIFNKSDSNQDNLNSKTYYMTYKDTKAGTTTYRSVELNLDSNGKFHVQQLASSSSKLFGTLMYVPTLETNSNSAVKKSIVPYQYYFTYNLAPISFIQTTTYPNYDFTASILSTAVINPIVEWNTKNNSGSFKINWEFGTKNFNYIPNPAPDKESSTPQLLSILTNFFKNLGKIDESSLDNNQTNVSQFIADFAPVANLDSYINAAQFSSKQKTFLITKNINQNIISKSFEDIINNDNSLSSFVSGIISSKVKTKTATINITNTNPNSDLTYLDQITTYNNSGNLIDLLYDQSALSKFDTSINEAILKTYNAVRNNIWTQNPTKISSKLPQLVDSSKFKSYADELNSSSSLTDKNILPSVKFNGISDKYSFTNIVNAANMANFIAYFKEHMKNVNTNGVSLLQILSNLSKYDKTFNRNTNIVTLNNNELSLNETVVSSDTLQTEFTIASAKVFTNNVIKHFEPIPNKHFKNGLALILEIVIPTVVFLTIVIGAVITTITVKKKRYQKSKSKRKASETLSPRKGQ